MVPPAARTDASLPLQVAMLIPGYPPAYSGAGAQAAQLAGRLSRVGVHVTVLCRAPDDVDAPAREEQGSLRVRRFRSPRLDVRYLVFGLRSALWLLLRRDWQVLHLHGFNYWALPACLVARLRGRPVLVKTTLLGPGADGALRGRLSLPRRVIAGWYRRVDAVVALSDALEASFHEESGYRAQIFRIPNGVDTQAFRPAGDEESRTARERFGLPQDQPVVITVGRLEARKNVVGLLEAAARIRTRPVCLVLVGPPSPDPSDRSELQRAIAALPKGIEARLLGELAPAELPEALRCADVLVLPSRAEGMPNSLLEGMAAGLACIATDIPGSRDVLCGGGGSLVPLDDPDAMAEELDACLESREERVRRGQEARRVVEERFSLEQVASRYVELYRALIAGM